MERIFASKAPLVTPSHRILLCSDHYSAPMRERVLPDGAIHLIFNLGDRQAGERGADLACLAMGATCEPTRIVLAGNVEQVCVRLRVGAASAILGVPAGELNDRGVDLGAIWGPSAHEALERLYDLPSGKARVALVASVLDERLRRVAAPPPSTVEAIRRIAASQGRIRVRDLAAGLGLGERRLQQLFHQHVGLSPKALCRLTRFRDVLSRCSGSRAPWTEVALEAGYYDQAHFVNEVRAFTGFSPGELARRGDFGFLQEDCAPAG